MLPVCKAASCVIKPKLCQALSELGLQRVLLRQQGLPISVLLLLIDPLQCSSACLNVLQWYTFMLCSMRLLNSYQQSEQMEASFQGWLHAGKGMGLPEGRQTCMISSALQTSPDQNDRVWLLTCTPTCAGLEPALAATGRDAAGAATGAPFEAAAPWLADFSEAALSAAAASRMLPLAANGSFTGASTDRKQHEHINNLSVKGNILHHSSVYQRQPEQQQAKAMGVQNFSTCMSSV